MATLYASARHPKDAYLVTTNGVIRHRFDVNLHHRCWHYGKRVKWLFGRQPKPQQPASRKADLDQETLGHLAKADGNLALPTEIINYLYLPDESRARQAGSDLTAAGYRVDVRPAATGPSWLTLAKIDMIPSTENIAVIRQRFDELASRFGGEYDGWEAAVTT